MVALCGIQLRFQRQAGKTDNPVKRRTQLVRHISQKLRFNTRRFLGALFRQVQFNVLDLHLLQGFAQIRGGLIDIVLHLFVIGRQRHCHRINTVLKHVQLAEHKPLHPAVQLAAADTVYRVNHIANRPGDIAHESPAENERNTDTEQNHQA